MQKGKLEIGRLFHARSLALFVLGQSLVVAQAHGIAPTEYSSIFVPWLINNTIFINL